MFYFKMHMPITFVLYLLYFSFLGFIFIVYVHVFAYIYVYAPMCAVPVRPERAFDCLEL